MASAVLTGLALLTSYASRVNLGTIDILSSGAYAMAGALVGAMLPFAFGAVTMLAVAQAAQGVVYEVRRQFKTIPGIMEGTAKPDYDRCIAFVTQVGGWVDHTPVLHSTPSLMPHPLAVRWRWRRRRS
jgi:K(+)-stimulated pyrophosphate-energized sodium pump